MKVVFDILTAAPPAEMTGKEWLATLQLEMGIEYKLLTLIWYHIAAETQV